jgi:tetratricopeptide (TPR) repeat protein
MKLTNPFKKKTIQKEVAVPLTPEEIPTPTDFESFMRRGWAYHSRGQEQQAEQDLRQALKLDADSVDANYVMGLVMKAQENKEEAIVYFKKAVDLIEAGKIEDKSKKEIMHRLANGHYNELTIGDWNLEKEIWQHIS